ncbi:MAG: response regulator transcription factor [Cyanobacteria bacterium P01_G01_bin.19]
MIRILIVDDQNLVQQGIKSLLARDLDFKVIGTVKDGRHAVQQIAHIHPDVVLLDIEMPGMDGITTTKYINRVSPQSKVIILSSHEEKKYVTQALMAGAKGYILKTSLMTDLKQAIQAVHNGYSQIDSRLLAKVFDPQNIKVKKAKATKKGDLGKEQDSDGENTAKLLSDSEYDRSVTESQEIEGTLATHEALDSPTSLEIDKAETVVRTNEIEADSSQSSQSESGSIAEKQPEKEPNQILSSASSQKAIATISHQDNVKLFTNRSKSETSYLARVLERPEISRNKPLTRGFLFRGKPQKSKFLRWAKKRRHRNLLWNIGFIFLGSMVVILIANLL